MAKKATGRTLRLTKDLQDRLVAIIGRGNYATTACAACGVSETTFYRWMELGDDHLELRNGRKVMVKAAPPYREFREAVEKAKANAQMLHMEAIRNAAFKTIDVVDPQTGQRRVEVQVGNWTAAAWFLERTAPHQYSRREVVHQGEGASPKKPEMPGKKVVRFGGRYRENGSLQASALPDPAPPE